MTDSSTGGYLVPAVASPPLEDDALDDVVHDLIAGVTGLSPALVRPRWQPNVPKQPDPSVNWCAFGIADQPSDDSPAIVHNSENGGSDTYIRHQDLMVQLTFYGPGAKGYAQMLIDGLAIPQNREQLKAQDMAFVSTSEIRPAPDFVNQQWVRRYDMAITLRRQITRTYAVLNLASVQATTTTDASVPVTHSFDTPL